MPGTIDKRIEEIKRAVPLTRDRAVVLAGSMSVKAMIRQIRPLIMTIEEFEDEIKRLFQKHPDRLVFESLPGAGEALAPRLLAAFGADRERWQSAVDMQQFSGIAPVTKQSGNSTWIQWRLACPKFVRQTFHEFADRSRVWCEWAKAYYRDQRNRGKSHHKAIRALAYKWIRILFVCWKNRIPYQEEIFLKSLAQRGSRLPELVLALPPRKSKQKAA